MTDASSLPVDFVIPPNTLFYDSANFIVAVCFAGTLVLLCTTACMLQVSSDFSEAVDLRNMVVFGGLSWPVGALWRVSVAQAVGLWSESDAPRQSLPVRLAATSVIMSEVSAVVEEAAGARGAAEIVVRVSLRADASTGPASLIALWGVEAGAVARVLRSGGGSSGPETPGGMSPLEVEGKEGVGGTRGRSAGRAESEHAEEADRAEQNRLEALLTAPCAAATVVPLSAAEEGVGGVQRLEGRTTMPAALSAVFFRDPSGLRVTEQTDVLPLVLFACTRAPQSGMDGHASPAGAGAGAGAVRPPRPKDPKDARTVHGLMAICEFERALPADAARRSSGSPGSSLATRAAASPSSQDVSDGGSGGGGGGGGGGGVRGAMGEGSLVGDGSRVGEDRAGRDGEQEAEAAARTAEEEEEREGRRFASGEMLVERVEEVDAASVTVVHGADGDARDRRDRRGLGGEGGDDGDLVFVEGGDGGGGAGGGKGEGGGEGASRRMQQSAAVAPEELWRVVVRSEIFAVLRDCSIEMSDLFGTPHALREELRSVYDQVVPRLATAESAATSIPPNPDDQDEVCIVCLSLPRTIALLPCRHCCLCPTCAQRVEQCPICRSEIRALVQFDA